MNVKNLNRRTIVQVLIWITLFVFGAYIYQQYQTNQAANQIVLPTILATTQEATLQSQIETTPTATTAPVVSDTSGEWTRQDTTPNYDPGDPYGVKFGMTGMGILLVLILLNWLFGAAGSALTKRGKS